MTQTDTAPSPTEEITPTVAPRSKSARFWEWLWLGKTIRTVRTGAGRMSPQEVLLVDQARALLDLGERVRDRIASVSADSVDITALLLFHKAGVTALAALQKPSQSLEDAWLEKLPAIEIELRLDDVARLRASQLFPKDFPLDPALAPGQIKSDLDLLQQLVSSLILGLQGAERDLRFLRWMRTLRVTAVTVLVCVLAVAAIMGFAKLTAPHDLLLGIKPQTSSSYPEDLAKAGILFHTTQQLNPWAMFDLGAAKSLAGLEVQNRGDGVGDRAIPLVAEVSIDQKQWIQVARQDQEFENWKVSFPPVNARYLRLTAKKTTFLHLVYVKAY